MHFARGGGNFSRKWPPIQRLISTSCNCLVEAAHYANNDIDDGSKEPSEMDVRNPLHNPKLSFSQTRLKLSAASNKV
ncbi:hypothetical protein NPIL_233711 [Nephila pilipes]|uniref:Uncharacterized protein n=1 Tax=Nephila pilipes TaxID=299642 RepID=A0A8X6U7Y5_NEPPI|nr:hypothetical protein NPIL_233711 [Nephila pilipes]